MSTGWMARVEIPPEIQPAVKSIQDDSLDMLVVDMLCFVIYLGATTLTGRVDTTSRKML